MLSIFILYSEQLLAPLFLMVSSQILPLVHVAYTRIHESS